MPPCPYPVVQQEETEEEFVEVIIKEDIHEVSVEDFFSAVEQGNASLVAQALELNPILAHATCTDWDDETALFSVNDNLEVAELLLKHGADVNYVSEATGDTALFNLSEPSLVLLFLRYDANFHIENHDGLTASDIFEENEMYQMYFAVNFAMGTSHNNLSRHMLRQYQRMVEGTRIGILQPESPLSEEY